MAGNYYEIFVLDSKKGETAGIRYRVEWRENKVAFSLGIRIDIDKWNQETQRVKNNTTHGSKKISAKKINALISQYEAYTEQIFKKKPKINAEEFKLQFNILRGKIQEKPNDFWTIWQRFIITQSALNSWTSTISGRFNKLREKIKEHDPNTQLNQINDDYLADFMNFLFRQKYKNSTTARMLKNFKRFLRWAKNNNHYTGNSHETFKPKLKASVGKNVVIFLTPEELDQLIAFDPKSAKLQKVKDIYLFLCFTGLRISDYLLLKKSNFIENNIVITTKKTNDNLIIPLNDYSKEIAEKHNYDLPKISAQKFNNYLKELAKLAEINTPVHDFYYIGNERFETIVPKYELLTSHTGRKTFVVNAIILGIPAEVVMSFTGHADYKSMKPYLSIVKSLQQKEMKKFNRPNIS